VPEERLGVAVRHDPGRMSGRLVRGWATRVGIPLAWLCTEVLDTGFRLMAKGAEACTHLRPHSREVAICVDRVRVAGSVREAV